MKKHNAGSVTVTEQRRKEIAKARRIRRKEKLNALLDSRVKFLVVRLGQLQQQINTLKQGKQVEEPSDVRHE